MHQDTHRKALIRLLWGVVITISLLSATVTLPFLEYELFLPFVAMHMPTSTPRVYNHPLISEVVYNPIGDEPMEEWIELYNPGEKEFDLSQFKIGDAETRGDREGMLRFPTGARMAPKEVIVVANRASAFSAAYGFKPHYEMVESDPTVPNMIKYYPWATYNLELTDDGDEVILLNASDQIVDAVSWGSSTFAFDPSIPKVPEGCSLERNPADIDRDSAVDWLTQSIPAPGQVDLNGPTQTPTTTAMSTSTWTPTPTETPIPCSSAPLLVSEILFDPLGDLDPEREWIEIYNPSEITVNLTCVKIGDEETSGGGEGMLQFPRGAMLTPEGLVVVANQAKSFLDTYGFYPDFEMFDSDPSIPDMLKYSTWASGSVNLSNGGDDVLILNGDDHLVDTVSWGDSVFAFDPSVSSVMEGHSIERRPANLDTDSAFEWQDQPNPNPGKVDLSTPTPTPSATPTSTYTITPTYTETPIPCGKISLLISEVLYDPVGTDTGAEWIEIYNPSNQEVNLTCAKVGDEETKGGGEGMLVFPDNRVIKPGEVVVVANRALIFRATYGFAPDYEIIESDPAVTNMLRYSSWGTGSFNLSNSGDEVLIMDWVDRLVDALSWGSSTFAFDPPIPLVSEGHSLERVPAHLDTNSAEDWFDRSIPDPGAVTSTTQPATATPKPTRTKTPTPTKTAKPTPTKTSTPKPTKTSTPTLKPIPSQTSSSTPIPSPSHTSTSIPTPSASPTSTSTPTPSPSQTSTSTSTPSPTATETPTETPSPTNTTTPSTTPTSSQDKVTLLISEVLYDPISLEPDDEWIEIYNPGSVMIELANYKLGDEETSGGSEGMMRFPHGSSIGPGEVIVIAYRAKSFYNINGFLPDYEFEDSILEVPNMVLYPDWSSGNISLNNLRDEVLLLDDHDRVKDVVAYGDSLYPDFQPPVPGVSEGYSIERRPASQDTDGYGDWIGQSNPNPGVVY